jgi:phosphoribosylglycinamide formyltransferase 1
VPVFDHDSAEDLAERVGIEEHRAYPEAIQLFVEGRLKVEGRRVKILDRAPGSPSTTAGGLGKEL